MQINCNIIIIYEIIIYEIMTVKTKPVKTFRLQAELCLSPKNLRKRKVKNDKCLKNVFSVCSFAHLLCVHIVFPFFFLLLTRAVIVHPFTKMPVPVD